MGLNPSPSGETFRFLASNSQWGKVKYRTSSHSRYVIKYDFVWVTTTVVTTSVFLLRERRTSVRSHEARTCRLQPLAD